MIKVIFASGLYGEFGYRQGFPWKTMFKADMDSFKAFTTGCTIVCGRKTFESLPCAFRGLTFIVLSSSKHEDIKAKNGNKPFMVVGKDNCKDVSEYLIYLDSIHKDDICVIGGGDLIMKTIDTIISVGKGDILYTAIVPKSDIEMNADVYLDEYDVQALYNSCKKNGNIENFGYDDFDISICRLTLRKNDEK